MAQSIDAPFHAVGALPDHEVLIVVFPLLVGVLCAVIVGVTWLSGRGLLRPLHEPVGLKGFLGWLCAGLSVGAGVIHQAVVPDHLAQWWVFGVLFFATALVQFAWAVAYLVRPGRRLALAGVMINSGIIAVWVVSRSVGLPAGPAAGRPDQVGFVDLVATVLEVVLVGVLVARLLPRTAARLDSRRVSFGDASIGGTFSVLVIAIVCAVAISGLGAGQ